MFPGFLKILNYYNCNAMLISSLKFNQFIIGSKQKIDENIEAEVIGVCQMDAIYAFGEEKVFEIDTSASSLEEVVAAIQSVISSPGESTRIDWMATLEEEGRVDEFLRD